MEEIKENEFRFVVTDNGNLMDHLCLYQWTVYALLWMQENLTYLSRHPNVNIHGDKTTINVYVRPGILSETVQEDFNRCLRETEGRGKITYFLEGITILVKDGDAHF